ncbi:hypothetical protein ACTFIR_011892, partial [Dictyostelium discoideum]
RRNINARTRSNG